MLDLLLLVNLFLVVVVLCIEIIALRKRPENRFARAVGVLGLVLLLIGYSITVFTNNPNMPTMFLRPGFSLFFAYNVSRGFYEFYRR